MPLFLTFGVSASLAFFSLALTILFFQCTVNNVRVPIKNLIGKEGDGLKYMFNMCCVILIH